MSRSALHLVVTLGVAAIASASHAGIVNPSFEDVYPSPREPLLMLPVGWTTEVPEEGWDAVYAEGYDIYVGSPITPTDGRAMAIATSPWRLWQTVTLTAGDTILVDVAMATNSTQAFGTAVIGLGSGSDYSGWTNLSTYSSFKVPYPGISAGPGASWIGWQTLSLTVPATGTYDLVLIGSFSHNGDGSVSTYFDNIRVIPGPGAAGLLTVGGLLVARRRR
ncbi:MAG: hypothetical protein K2X32_04425 [Phycisphaerales bacterium]|nr:hypothetical protein [Phycisphaerales bacterium]